MRCLPALVACLILALALMARVPAIAVTSTSISINPAATDGYDIQGRFSGLTLDGASSISLSVGKLHARPRRSDVRTAGVQHRTRRTLQSFRCTTGDGPASGCTMVRVQQANPGSYQLAPGDPAGMTCELSTLTVAQPDVLVTGAPAGRPDDRRPGHSHVLGDSHRTLCVRAPSEYITPISFVLSRHPFMTLV